MANNFRLANAAADAAAGDGSSVGLAGYIGASAVVKFYVGAQGASPEAAPAGTLLSTSGNVVTGSFSNASGDGETDTATVASDTAVASGTAGSFMLFKSDGTTPVADGTVGTASTDFVFDNAVFVSGGTIAVSTIAIQVPPH